MSIATMAVLILAEWVRRTHGARNALVMLVLSAAALVAVWLAYEVWPLERWRRDNLAVGLAIFVVPALAATVIAQRRHTLWSASAIYFVIALWVTPAVLLYVSQRVVFADAADPSFTQSLWWAASTLVIYVSIPVIYARATGQRVRSYGLSLGFIRSEAVFIGLIAPVIIVLVWLASADARFAATYPFYDDESGVAGSWAKLLVFELAYGATFVALEFFFRGFLVFAGLPVLGVSAVPVMALAYCLLHLGKPMPECAASLVGGLILGYVALRLRSIAAGVVAHLTMAWGMDASVIARR